MSLRRHVPCLQQHLKRRGDHVWISDDALDIAFQRFTHARIPRRHVGLAPGPLEARKRASKRRMMNLAQVGGGADLDPTLLPQMGVEPEKGWRWQSPSPASINQSKGLHPFLAYNESWSANMPQIPYRYHAGLQIPTLSN